MLSILFNTSHSQGFCLQFWPWRNETFLKLIHGLVSIRPFLYQMFPYLWLSKPVWLSLWEDFTVFLGAKTILRLLIAHWFWISQKLKRGHRHLTLICLPWEKSHIIMSNFSSWILKSLLNTHSFTQTKEICNCEILVYCTAGILEIEVKRHNTFVLYAMKDRTVSLISPSYMYMCTPFCDLNSKSQNSEAAAFFGSICPHDCFCF